MSCPIQVKKKKDICKLDVNLSCIETSSFLVHKLKSLLQIFLLTASVDLDSYVEAGRLQWFTFWISPPLGDFIQLFL